VLSEDDSSGRTLDFAPLLSANRSLTNCTKMGAAMPQSVGGLSFLISSNGQLGENPSDQI
jgi:hypothetical protein